MITYEELEKIFNDNSFTVDKFSYGNLVMEKVEFISILSSLLEKEYTRGFLEGAIHERNL